MARVPIINTAAFKRGRRDFLRKIPAFNVPYADVRRAAQWESGFEYERQLQQRRAAGVPGVNKGR